MLCFFLCTACGHDYQSTSSNSSNSLDIIPTPSYCVPPTKDEIIQQFTKWNTTTIEQNEKQLIVANFGDYIFEFDDLSSEDLENIPGDFSVHQIGDAVVVTYIESAEIYGQSGRGIYTYPKYGHGLEIIFSDDTKRIDEAIQDPNNKYTYYLLGTDDGSQLIVKELNGDNSFNLTLTKEHIYKG